MLTDTKERKQKTFSTADSLWEVFVFLWSCVRCDLAFRTEKSEENFSKISWKSIHKDISYHLTRRWSRTALLITDFTHLCLHSFTVATSQALSLWAKNWRAKRANQHTLTHKIHTVTLRHSFSLMKGIFVKWKPIPKDCHYKSLGNWLSTKTTNETTFRSWSSHRIIQYWPATLCC